MSDEASPAKVATPHSLITPSFAGDLILLNLVFAVGLAALWPIFHAPWFLVTAGLGLVCGNLLVIVANRRRWSWWLTTAVFAAVYAIGGVPVAAPSVFSSPASLPARLLGVLTAPVTGWKDLLTLEIPLGTYQSTSALVFFLAMGVPLVALSIAWRSRRLWVAAAPVGLLLVFVGIAFGSSSLRGQVQVGSFQALGTEQVIVGLLAILSAFGWVAWRLAAARRAVLVVAEDAAGTQARRRPRARKIFQQTTGVAMVAVALLVGFVVAPWMLEGHSRQVLRSAVDPELALQAQVSPLATYREYFGDDLYDAPLFTVQADRGATRIRLATLTSYDGSVADVVASSDTSVGTFQRVPYVVRGNQGQQVAAQVTVGQYRGTWVPIIGALESVSFTGPSKDALSDGFFYNREADTAVELAAAGLAENDQYNLVGTTYMVPAAELASFTPRGGARLLREELVPESLTRWMAAQDVGTDGAGLQELISRLQARGYLSHSLTVDLEAPPLWMQELGDYSFAPSRSGHSVDRIDGLFTELLERQESLGPTADPSLLVAAAGDDEQFAVAAALIADQLGFESRIVVGAILSAGTGEKGNVVPCAEGVCTGANVSVWIEVRDGDSDRWAAIDVTPQHDIAPTLDIEQVSNPKNQTDVDPKLVAPIVPPDPSPRDSQGDADDTTQPDPAPVQDQRLARVVGAAALGIVVLAGPFLLIVGAKLIRRNFRRQDPRTNGQVLGGWEEFVDAAIDQGEQLPGSETRLELARLYGGDEEITRYLATVADGAAFSALSVGQTDAQYYWQVVGSAKTLLTKDLTEWKRLRARLSLRSFFARVRLTAANPAQKQSVVDVHNTMREK